MADFVWKRPPEALVDSLDERFDEAKLLEAIAAVAGRRGTLMHNDARRNAPWQDRTGNARSGLFSAVEVDHARKRVIIYLSHAADLDYPKYLELAHQGRYAIIMRTIEQHVGDLVKDLAYVFGD